MRIAFLGTGSAFSLERYNGDHVLGLPPFFFYRAFFRCRPLAVVGPPGVERRLDGLLRLAWGDAWLDERRALDVSYHEAQPSGEVAGIRYEAVALEHGGMDCRGYR